MRSEGERAHMAMGARMWISLIQTWLLTNQSARTIHVVYNIVAEIATVTTAYTATGPDQLSLVPGQYIAVKVKNANGWWEGQLQVQ